MQSKQVVVVLWKAKPALVSVLRLLHRGAAIWGVDSELSARCSPEGGAGEQNHFALTLQGCVAIAKLEMIWYSFQSNDKKLQWFAAYSWYVLDRSNLTNEIE